MPRVSVIMPVYNVEEFVADAIRSVLSQTFTDFELIIVDDVSPDGSIAICESFQDARIRLVRHPQNRGLASARNSGIRVARGEYLAFLDSDDMWRPSKLASHVRHLDEHAAVGLSFSRSEFMAPDGTPIDYYQMPRLSGIDTGYLLRRNPVGNGSAPVIRRAALDAIRFEADVQGAAESCWFDETFRQSEDIECWVRLAATTHWKIEGIPEPLTLYRLNAGGLSANLLKQLGSWEQMIVKLRGYRPDLLAGHERAARAYQLRYLARQAIRLNDGLMALRLSARALVCHPFMLYEEPGRTLMTASAAVSMSVLPRNAYRVLEALAQALVGRYHRFNMYRNLNVPQSVPGARQLDRGMQ